ncbi:uncharacterized protein LOC115755050 isoform X3 [Rhodamnia argentea]|uniref:Uncharacterized protein LOC115755050 isoform X3 n=1 Tax=Rhodamnia argentea TaxID=178133 RepID=A0ABM3H0E8_9MYRT|nr:uncharacterized protein LOC115755050 isoform X3 [Rhodamnia argentea]
MRFKSTPVSSLKQQTSHWSASRTRTKHKRLDAICEETYNLNHAESNRQSTGDEEVAAAGSELRRSSRARRAPVLLDASPPPRKKRRKLGKNGRLSGEKNVRALSPRVKEDDSENGEDEETPGTWRSRLRSRRRIGFGRNKERNSPRRKLFAEMDGVEKECRRTEGVVTEGKVEMVDKIEELEVECPLKVKLKRKRTFNMAGASRTRDKVLVSETMDGTRDDETGDEGNDCGEVERPLKVKLKRERTFNVAGASRTRDKVLVSETMDGTRDDETGDEGNDCGEVMPLEGEMLGIHEDEEADVNDMDLVVEKQEELSNSNQAAGDCAVSDHVTVTEDVEQGECMDETVTVDLNEVVADLSINDVRGGPHDGKDANLVKLDEKLMEGGGYPKEDKNTSQRSGERPVYSHIKEGRRCGLCGGGTDGKPPKRLTHEIGESENEASNGSSASDEANYDIWDGFADEPGWLGRLLGPINDRYGIAGTWVHQQCAVWSPECFQVYFAGLGCLKNVRAALCRGRALKCSRCGRPGATIGCRVDRCPKTYHLPCARADGCIFDHRKFLIACIDHRHYFQPFGSKMEDRIKRMKAKKMKMEFRKLSNDAWRKDIETEEKWLENCGEDEEFLKRESKRLQRDLMRISPVYIGGTDKESQKLFAGWESVAGLQDVIRCMKEVVILPLLYPEFFDNLGITPPRGVLLHGYPGTGKTLVVRSLIGSCARGDKRIAYFARKGADCLGKYVGDAERQLRLLFHVAEKCQPSIIFFDEIDGLAPCRTKQSDQTHSSVVSTLLALLDGLKSRGSVVVIGATNRPDAVDPALRRPGRFDREIYFPLPSLEDRAAILALHTQKWPKPVLGSLLRWIAGKTAGFAGADLQALCTQAAIIALKRNFPLQDVLSAAGKNSSCSERVPLPSFAVEERDWLEALSSSPPPCSRREAGIASTDIASSSLPCHLIPCLLQPLSTLLVSLYLDEHVSLPPALSKAAAGVKNVIFSALDRRKLPNHLWWSHLHSLIQEAEVGEEIERLLYSADIAVGESVSVGSDAFGVGENREYINPEASVTYNCGSHTGSARNMPFSSRKKSGHRVLISGSPRSGQRHLASCLLRCYIGNVGVHKVDLAIASQEGHGDVVQGLTQILMKCANVGSSVVFMPRIDLWAVQTHQQVSDDGDSSTLFDDQSSVRKTSCSIDTQVLKTKITSNMQISKSTAVYGHQSSSQSPSHAWSSFAEQVEAICVNTSLVILATSDVPHAELPIGIRQFFGCDVQDGNQCTSLEHTLPRFNVQIDGSVNYDVVINRCAAELSRNVVRQFVQLFYQKAHKHPIPDNETSASTGDQKQTPNHNLDRPLEELDPRTQNSDDSVPRPSLVLNKRNLKGKSSLMLGISTLGYQILRYPHFAELCWVTSKLKEGPVADISGSWKGWPFNSCIARPSNIVEKMAVPCNPGNIKSKEGSLLVRGIAAVGLLAYRGLYTSGKEVAFEIRRVLELLVGQISVKVQAGKDRYQYVQLLSQVSYLEDIVNSWAFSLQSLEVDAQVGQANPVLSTTASSANDLQLEEHQSPISGRSSPEARVLEETRPDSAAENVDPSVCNNENGDSGLHDFKGRVGLLQDDIVENISLFGNSTPNERLCSSIPAGISVGKSLLECNEANAINQLESPGESTNIHGVAQSFNHPYHSVSADDVVLSKGGACPSGQMGGAAYSGSSRGKDQVKAPASKDNSTLSPDDVPDSDKPSSGNFSSCKNINALADSMAVCLYRCCSVCMSSLHDVMRKLLIHEAGFSKNSWNIEDIHDVVASLSVDLVSAVRQEFSNASSLFGEIQRNSVLCPDISTCDCKSPGCRLSVPVECAFHSTDGGASETVNTDRSSQFGQSVEFVFRNGVLISTNHDRDVACHCKLESLCLSSLVELMLSSKQLPK